MKVQKISTQALIALKDALSNVYWRKKELRQYFSSLTGYIAIIVFLLVNGLVLFVFEDNIFDFFGDWPYLPLCTTCPKKVENQEQEDTKQFQFYLQILLGLLKFRIE